MAKKDDKKTSKQAAPQKGAAAPSKKDGGKKKPKSVEDILKAKYGKDVLQRGDADRKTYRVSWGCFGLDFITGGGIVLGRITEIHGEESSGKSSLALLLAKEFIKLGKKVYWIDIENSWDDNTKFWAIKLGIDPSKIEVLRPVTGEDALGMVRIVVEHCEDALVVVDSWAAITSSKEIEVDAGHTLVGVNALLCNQAIRQIQTALNLPTAKTAVLVINQLRATINQGMGPKTTTPGGWGLRFTSGVRIRLKRIEWLNQTIQGEKVTVGQTISFKTVKNKTYPPYKEVLGTFYVMANKYGPAGFDNIRAMIRYGKLWGRVREFTGAKKKDSNAPDPGYYFVDLKGELVRLGKDENQAVFQFNKPEWSVLRAEFEQIITKEAKHLMSIQQGSITEEEEFLEEEPVEEVKENEFEGL